MKCCLFQPSLSGSQAWPACSDFPNLPGNLLIDSPRVLPISGSPSSPACIIHKKHLKEELKLHQQIIYFSKSPPTTRWYWHTKKEFFYIQFVNFYIERNCYLLLQNYRHVLTIQISSYLIFRVQGCITVFYVKKSNNSLVLILGPNQDYAHLEQRAT